MRWDDIPQGSKVVRGEEEEEEEEVRKIGDAGSHVGLGRHTDVFVGLQSKPSAVRCVTGPREVRVPTQHGRRPLRALRRALQRPTVAAGRRPDGGAARVSQ